MARRNSRSRSRRGGRRYKLSGARSLCNRLREEGQCNAVSELCNWGPTGCKALPVAPSTCSFSLDSSNCGKDPRCKWSKTKGCNAKRGAFSVKELGKTYNPKYSYDYQGKLLDRSRQDWRFDDQGNLDYAVPNNRTGGGRKSKKSRKSKRKSRKSKRKSRKSKRKSRSGRKRSSRKKSRSGRKRSRSGRKRSRSSRKRSRSGRKRSRSGRKRSRKSRSTSH